MNAKPQANQSMHSPRITQKGTEPAFIEPKQCKPVTVLPADENWTFEIKFDGYRCIAVKHGREVTLFSRHEKVLSKRFPTVVKALASLGGDFALDGELVALDSQGKPSFQLLQNSLSQSLPIYFYAFDLLNRNGNLLVNLPFSRRRELLEGLLAAPDDPMRVSPLLRAPSGQVVEAVRKLGLEGVVGKRIDSIYEPGERSGAWIKHRTNREQEFVIGGYMPQCARIRCVARGCLLEERAHLRREGEGRICAANSGRNPPSSQEAQSCALPVPKSAREKSLAVGRVVNRRENGTMSLGQAEARLPGRIPRKPDPQLRFMQLSHFTHFLFKVVT